MLAKPPKASRHSKKPAHSTGDAQALPQRIWNAVATIPCGRVATYGQIARLAGAPGRARMVGRCLGQAPAHLALPWHRVVNAQGRISLPEGSDGARWQQTRLEAEGVCFKSGRIDLAAHGWQPRSDAPVLD